MAKHRKLEPIRLEDLESNPCASGLESVLRFPAPPSISLFPVQKTETSPEVTAGGPNKSAPNLTALEVNALNVDAPALTALDLPRVGDGAPEQDASSLGAPNTGAPDIGGDYPLAGVYAYRPRRRILQEATSAESGHTHGEQVLYETLWRLGKPIGQGTTRALSIGERTLAAEVPMAYSTVQQNARSLEQKLAIEIRSGGPYHPKTYVVFGCDDILHRRRAAGLTHILRRTSGVILIGPTNPQAP